MKFEKIIRVRATRLRPASASNELPACYCETRWNGLRAPDPTRRECVSNALRGISRDVLSLSKGRIHSSARRPSKPRRAMNCPPATAKPV